jgi:hypothetical protein
MNHSLSIESEMHDITKMTGYRSENNGHRIHKRVAKIIPTTYVVGSIVFVNVLFTPHHLP